MFHKEKTELFPKKQNYRIFISYLFNNNKLYIKYVHTVPPKKYTAKIPTKLSVQKNTDFGIPYTDFLWLQLSLE